MFSCIIKPWNDKYLPLFLMACFQSKREISLAHEFFISNDGACSIYVHLAVRFLNQISNL